MAEFNVVPGGKIATGTGFRVDYVKDGNLYIGSIAQKIILRGINDLAYLPEGEYAPGSIAYLPDGSKTYVLAANGAWKLQPDDSESGGGGGETPAEETTFVDVIDHGDYMALDIPTNDLYNAVMNGTRIIAVHNNGTLQEEATAYEYGTLTNMTIVDTGDDTEVCAFLVQIGDGRVFYGVKGDAEDGPTTNIIGEYDE